MRRGGCYDDKDWGREAEYVVEPGAGIRLLLEYEVKSPLSKSVRGLYGYQLIMYLYLYMTYSKPCFATYGDFWVLRYCRLTF